LLFDIGINHTSNFKPVYHPAYKHNSNYFTPESLYPGYFSIPVFNFQTNLTYRYYFYKNFSINIAAKSLYHHSISTRNIDSVRKYYFFPDSIIEKLTYSPIPLYEEYRILQFGLSTTVGYRYKRLQVYCGIYFPLFGKVKSYREYERNNISNFIDNEYYNFFDFANFDIRTEFMIIKNKIPISLVFEFNKLFYGGIQIDITSIGLK